MFVRICCAMFLTPLGSLSKNGSAESVTFFKSSQSSNSLFQSMGLRCFSSSFSSLSKSSKFILVRRICIGRAGEARWPLAGI